MALLHTSTSPWNKKTVLFIHGIGFQPALYSEPLYQILRAEDSATADATRWHEVVYSQADVELKAKIVELQKVIPPPGSPPSAMDIAADCMLDLVDYLATNSLYDWINNFVRQALLAAIKQGTDDGVMPADQKLIFIAHSLGTVVAYEVVHSIVDDPQIPGVSSGVKIKTLITLGCPIAFIKARQAQIPSLNTNFFLRKNPVGRPSVTDPFSSKPVSNITDWFNYRQYLDPVGSLVPLDQTTSNKSLSADTSVFKDFNTGVNPHDFANYITEYKSTIMGMLRA
jgi:hypothetical protein